MDVTPELLTEYKFKEEWRGYNRDEVDDFLERLAAALGELQARYEQVVERAEKAERQPPQESGSEQQLRRTLVLAQRTADAVLEEAKAEGEQIVADAQEQARVVVAEAEERAAILEADVIHRTRTELGAIATRRAELTLEVEALASFVAEHRGRLQAELREQLNWLARPGRLELPPSPPLSPLPESVLEVEEPEDEFAPDEDAQYDEEEVESSYAPAETAYSEPSPEAYQWDVVPQAWQQELEAERADLGELDPADDPTGEVRAVDTNGHEASDGSDSGATDGGAEGSYRYADEVPTDAPVGEVGAAADEVHPDLLEIEDDPFLAELRRAVTDPEPLGPREADRSSWDTSPASEENFPAADLFGRKRRR
jgi:DivIVA domain-containing protein